LFCFDLISIVFPPIDKYNLFSLIVNNDKFEDGPLALEWDELVVMMEFLKPFYDGESTFFPHFIA
jgi:hypothetical protein